MVRKHLQLIAASCGVMLVAGGALASQTVPAQARSNSDVLLDPARAVPSTTWYVDAELIDLLQKEASRQLAGYLQDNDELRMVDVGITLDPENELLFVNFGEGFLPGPNEGYAELFLNSLAPTLRHYSGEAGIHVQNVRFLFQGKPIEHYFPEDQAVPLRSRSVEANRTALVSSSHGFIRVFPSQEWKLQRPVAFGYVEDTITPAFGDELQQLLEARSGLTVHRARRRSTEAHPESGHPWGHMSARYHLKELLPERTDIWHSLPTSTAKDREVSEDIRARPLYANHLAVGSMVSLHTNGNPSASVRGTEVFHHENKPEDRPFAESVLCGMRELIRAQPGYEGFPVQARAQEGRHGENRIGTMPSVLVEIAYHSNAEDSAALQDPVFRAASMKGVEKGVRLFREGKTCEPFVLQPIPDVSLATGSSQEITLPFAGNPQFPVTREFRTANCSSPGACTPSKATYDDPNAPITVVMRCRGSLAGTARWSVVLRDVDGVATAPVEFQQTCSKP